MTPLPKIGETVIYYSPVLGSSRSKHQAAVVRVESLRRCDRRQHLVIAQFFAFGLSQTATCRYDHGPSQRNANLGFWTWVSPWRRLLWRFLLALDHLTARR